MNRLAVFIFPDQTRIDGAIGALNKFHSERNIKVYGSAVITKGTDGRFSVQEITKEGHGGVFVAALIGALAGLPAGPAAAAILATGGAMIGSAADLSAEDDFNEFANNVADSIAPGCSAVVADVAEDSVATVKARMRSLGATVLDQ